MDIAAFKVCHSVGIDKNATALRAARTRSSSIGAMEEMSGNVQNVALTYCDAEIKSTRTTAGQFKGALDEGSKESSKMQAHRNS